MMTKIPCFACGAVLQQVADHIVANQPDSGLAFTTGGHYGSTFFEPMRADTRLEINVCDDRLRERGGRVLFVQRGLKLVEHVVTDRDVERDFPEVDA